MGLYFDKELAELRTQGVGLADLTNDEVVALVRATDRLRNPFSNVNLELCGQPRQVTPGVALWPFTVGASVWMDEYASRWWIDAKGNHAKAFFWATVYALAHGRDPGAFSKLTDETSAYEAIRAFALGIHATEDEITEAVDDCLGISRHADDARKRANLPRNPESGEDWAEVIRVLEVRTGIPAERWIWSRGRDYVVAAFREAQRVVTAFGEAKMPRMKNELDHALNEIAHLRASIVARVKATREGGAAK